MADEEIGGVLLWMLGHIKGICDSDQPNNGVRWILFLHSVISVGSMSH